jgi:hypothetical protein
VEERDRSRDVLVVEVATGKLLVDNMDKYFGLFHLWQTFPGTREFLQKQRERTT